MNIAPPPGVTLVAVTTLPPRMLRDLFPGRLSDYTPRGATE